jgi:uncharacterized protein DUF6459
MTAAAVVEATVWSSGPGELRRLPTPVVDPPYDDELVAAATGAPTHPDQGALALTFTLVNGVPAVPAPDPNAVLRAMPDDDDFFEAQPTPREALPDPRPLAARLAQAIVEVVHGARPLAQLMRWTSPEVYADLERRLAAFARNSPTAHRHVNAGTVRSIHVSEPSPGVAEVCAAIRRGPRTLALALRFDGLDGRWRCTAVDFGS